MAGGSSPARRPSPRFRGGREAPSKSPAAVKHAVRATPRGRTVRHNPNCIEPRPATRAMVRCEQGYLCEVCGADVEDITASDLYLRYVLGEVDPETLHQSPERHLRC